jgi:radical SAM superfamily enzyme
VGEKPAGQRQYILYFNPVTATYARISAMIFSPIFELSKLNIK